MLPVQPNGNNKMIRFKLRLVLMSVLALTTCLAACSDSPDKGTSSSAFVAGDGILKYIPADTPYLFATPGDLPEDVVDILEPQMDAMLSAYHKLMLAFVDEQASVTTDDDGEAVSGAENIEEFMPIIDELGTLMSIDGLREAGFDRESDVAIYGMGLLPVFRVTLTDGSLFEAALARLEAKAESEFSVGEIDAHSYRYIDDEESRFVIAVIDNNLVMTAVPIALADEQLKEVLGITLPAQNIAASGALQKMADKHNFVDYMIGFIDIERIVATFIDEPTGINSELLSLMDYDTAAMSDVCKSETRAMAGVMPRIIMGYTSLVPEAMESKAIFELRSDLAAGVASLAGAVPGLGNEQGGLFSFGFSMDLLAAREFYSARLDALEAEPFQCEYFADLQGSVAQGRELLEQPVPPIVYGFKGVLAVIEDLQGMDMSNNQPPASVDMRMLVATDNAEGLLAMGTMYSPELAALQIKADGQPVKLDFAQAMMPAGADAYIAMSENGIAISIGAGMEQKLGAMLSADILDPSPVSAFEVDAGRYYEFIGESMSVPGDDEEPPPQEVREAMQEILGVMQNSFDRIYFYVDFTEQGIELTSKVSLNK